MIIADLKTLFSFFSGFWYQDIFLFLAIFSLADTVFGTTEARLAKTLSPRKAFHFFTKWGSWIIVILVVWILSHTTPSMTLVSSGVYLYLWTQEAASVLRNLAKLLIRTGDNSRVTKIVLRLASYLDGINNDAGRSSSEAKTER